MRIMISTSSYHPSMNGQAVFTTNLAEGMAKRGHQVMVMLDSPHGQPTEKVIHDVTVEELRSVSLGFFHAGVYFSPFPAKEISHLMDTFHPDIVHIQDHYPSCWMTVNIARKRGIKLVGSNHFIPENIAPYIPIVPHIKPVFAWIMWQWMLITYRHLDAIIAQSNIAASLIRQQGVRMPILPISCGIDLGRLYPNRLADRNHYCQKYGLDPAKKIFLFLGRMDGEKRIDLLVQAMRQVERGDVQLAIAGHGSVESKLKKMVARMGLENRVKFTGFIPAEDVSGLLNSIDIFVMPSEAELLSISTLEAMACGRPVLLADALALPELVREGINGYLFRPGDVDDLVRFMNLMADHPDRWGEMGAASRKIASSHDLDLVLQKYEKLYSQLISAVPVLGRKSPLEETI